MATKKPIDWRSFEELCHIQCTQSEIASVLHIHVDTLRDRTAEQYSDSFSNTYKKYSEGGKASVRRAQYRMAQKNTSMAIWWGKQYLDQKDNSAKELKDATKEGVIDAIRELEGIRSAASQTSRSPLEDKSPLLDTECTRQETSFQDELGTKGAI